MYEQFLGEYVIVYTDQIEEHSIGEDEAVVAGKVSFNGFLIMLDDGCIGLGDSNGDLQLILERRIIAGIQLINVKEPAFQ